VPQIEAKKAVFDCHGGCHVGSGGMSVQSCEFPRN
jgi:hypothetical protein